NMMHVPEDAGVRLIKGQFLSLGAYIYNQSQSFGAAQAEQRSQMDAHDRKQCAQVEKEATASQRKVLEAFGKGLRPQQVADALGIQLVTVHSHKTVLLRLCRNAWNIADHEHLDYHFLQAKFANYFEYRE